MMRRITNKSLRATRRSTSSDSDSDSIVPPMEDKSDYPHRIVKLADVIDAERGMRLLQSPTDDRLVGLRRSNSSGSNIMDRFMREDLQVRPLREPQPPQIHYQMHEALVHRTTAAVAVVEGRAPTASSQQRYDISLTPTERRLVPHFNRSSSSSSSSGASRSDDDERIFGPVRPLQLGCDDPWRWSRKHRSSEVAVTGPLWRTAFFHPNWSKGTAAVRGTRVLNNGRHYWEIHVTNRVFGTSMMFGIGTAQAVLEANTFTNLLGVDEHSWGLSHKGIVWHAGTGLRFTKCFQENLATTIGLLFDGINGTLTYYKDGVCLGIAFRGLNKVQEKLYPIVSSTAAKTEMMLAETHREFVSLQDRCRAVICKSVRTPADLQQLQQQMRLPPFVGRYLEDAIW